MHDRDDLQESTDEDHSQDTDLSMDEILRRQDLRNVLRPATTKLRSEVSEQYGLTGH